MNICLSETRFAANGFRVLRYLCRLWIIFGLKIINETWHIYEVSFNFVNLTLIRNLSDLKRKLLYHLSLVIFRACFVYKFWFHQSIVYFTAWIRIVKIFSWFLIHKDFISVYHRYWFLKRKFCTIIWNSSDIGVERTSKVHISIVKIRFTNSWHFSIRRLPRTNNFPT